MYLQVLLFVFVSLAAHGAYGFYPHTFGISSSRPSVCTSPFKPCRIQFVMRHFNGTPVNTMGTQTCACNYPHSCSDDWSRSDYVISRNLISNVYNMTLTMMFCRPVQPQRECNVGEEALVVKGSLLIPQEVETFNCRCRGDGPLLLRQRSIGSDHLTYHTYVCDSHQPTCPRRISQCMVMQPSVTDYTCKCPSGLFCKADYWDDVTYGYCRE